MVIAITLIKPENKRSVYCSREGMVLLRDGDEWDVLSFRYQEPVEIMPDEMADKRKLKPSLLNASA